MTEDEMGVILCVHFLCIICVKIIINLLQYSTIQPVVLVAFLGQICWTFEHTGVEKSFLEGNLFVCRELTVFQILECVLLHNIFYLFIQYKKRYLSYNHSTLERRLTGLQTADSLIQRLKYYHECHRKNKELSC